MIHDLTPILLPHYHRFHSQLLQRIFLKGILRRADLILANSQYTAADVARYLPEVAGRTVPILLGCDPVFRPVYTPAPLEDLGIRSPFFLSVGTIEPRKNLLRLLEAYTLYRRRCDGESLLVIAGQRGWKSEPFFEALQSHPFREDILVTGYVPDETLAILYSSAVAMIYPSEYEGFGLPLLEAFACGCPVLSSQVTSLPEVGGDVAFYFDPGDVQAMAERMRQVEALSEMERLALREACLQRAARFSWKAHVALLQKVLAGLGSGTMPPPLTPYSDV